MKSFYTFPKILEPSVYPRVFWHQALELKKYTLRFHHLALHCFPRSRSMSLYAPGREHWVSLPGRGASPLHGVGNHRKWVASPSPPRRTWVILTEALCLSPGLHQSGRKGTCFHTLLINLHVIVCKTAQKRGIRASAVSTLKKFPV